MADVYRYEVYEGLYWRNDVPVELLVPERRLNFERSLYVLNADCFGAFSTTTSNFEHIASSYP